MLSEGNLRDIWLGYPVVLLSVEISPEKSLLLTQSGLLCLRTRIFVCLTKSKEKALVP